MSSSFQVHRTANTVTRVNYDEGCPLLRQQTHAKKTCCKYKLPTVSEKGAVVVIVWNVFLNISICGQMKTGSWTTLVMSLVFPLAGFVADTWIGRYKVLKSSMYIMVLSSLIDIITRLTSVYVSLPPQVMTVMKVVMIAVSSVGMSSFLACTIPFTTDQMIGASSDQLSFTIHLILWGAAMGSFVNSVANIFADSQYLFLLPSCLSFVAAITASFIFWHWKRCLMIVPQISNPIKQIAQVLNYARKHTVPERRSALTYWEEDYPSRIDLGKSRYGGPFTVEEVEDVKTVLRLIPLVLCVAVSSIGNWIEWTDFLDSTCVRLDPRIESLLYNHTFVGGCAAAILLIPLYNFAVYPLFYKRIPSMLKRIRAGMFVVSFSFLISACLSTLQLCSTSACENNTSTCFFHLEAFNASSGTGYWWIALPVTLHSIGLIFVVIFLTEFIIAQSPHPIKGFMIGLMIASLLVVGGIAYAVNYSLRFVPSLPSLGLTTWFYKNLAASGFIMTGFVVFMFVSKAYKLRKRDDIVPYHMIAEDYFEKNYEREQQYMQQQEAFLSDIVD